MISNGSVPWYNVPPREFPVKRWLRQRYPFVLPPLAFARRPAAPSAPEQPERRPFPALAWLEGRARHPSLPARLKLAPQGYATKPL